MSLTAATTAGAAAATGWHVVTATTTAAALKVFSSCRRLLSKHDASTATNSMLGLHAPSSTKADRPVTSAVHALLKGVRHVLRLVRSCDWAAFRFIATAAEILLCSRPSEVPNPRYQLQSACLAVAASARGGAWKEPSTCLPFASLTAPL